MEEFKMAKMQVKFGTEGRKLTKEDKEYYEKHIIKAEHELRKLAFPNSGINFVSNINFIVDEKYGLLAYWQKSTRIIEVDVRYFKNKYKRILREGS